MSCALANTSLESSADHHTHVDALVTIVLKKHPHQRSASLVAIAPSAMEDSSSAVYSELEFATTDEPSMPNSDENGDTAPLNPQSDAQKLAALVRSKMTTDELLQDCPSSYEEGSYSGRSQSTPTSPQDSVDLSIQPSDLIYIDSLLAQDEALELEAMAQLQRRPNLRSRMTNRALSICVGRWRRKGGNVKG